MCVLSWAIKMEKVQDIKKIVEEPVTVKKGDRLVWLFMGIGIGIVIGLLIAMLVLVS